MPPFDDDDRPQEDRARDRAGLVVDLGRRIARAHRAIARGDCAVGSRHREEGGFAQRGRPVLQEVAATKAAR